MSVLQPIKVKFIRSRVAVASYCKKIYSVPSDDLNAAPKYKEAPIVDNTKILGDEETLKQIEYQSNYVTIPEEVFHKND